MPGQFKQGIDFWPRSVQLIRDPKLRVPKMQYGYLAVMVYELLLDLLFSDKGYYIDYSRKEDVIWTVLEGLMGKHQPTFETISEVTELLVACELFSGDHFKSEIITSRRSQITFYQATRKRTVANIDFSIWMLTATEMEELSATSVILAQFLQRGGNDSIIGGNDSIIGGNDPQSKEKKSKVKNIKNTMSGKPDSKPADSESGIIVSMYDDGEVLDDGAKHSSGRNKPYQAETCSQIIEHLNKRLGTAYKPDTKATVSQINARLNEGFMLADFIEVIDKKILEWGSRPDMAQYLRPLTLFGTKFEGYLNQPWIDGQKTSQPQPYKTAFERTMDTAKASLEEYYRGEDMKIDI